MVHVWVCGGYNKLLNGLVNQQTKLVGFTLSCRYHGNVMGIPWECKGMTLSWEYCFGLDMGVMNIVDIQRYIMIEGSFEVKLPTIWTDEKQSRAEAERRGRLEERRSEEKRKSKRTEDTDARKGRKVAKQCVFPMIWGSGGSKSRLAKAAGAEPAGQRRDEKLHAVVARSTF